MVTIAPARPPGWMTLRSVAVVALAAALFIVGVPMVSGAPWLDVGHQLGLVPAPALGLLAVVWAAGLLLHTITLTGGLPGLTHRRALTLSLTGSAVANVLPLGGAAGIALNYRMVRAWGHERAAFAAYTVVTNICDVLAKLSLPLVALPVAVLTGAHVLGRYTHTAELTTLLLGVGAALVAVAAVSRTITAAIGSAVDRTVGAVLRLLHVDREPRIQQRLLDLQAQCGWLFRNRWHRLTLGMAAYLASLALLLWGCLTVTGTGLAPAAVLVAFATERLLTLAGLTPGGAGIVEAGLAGVLVALGGDPVASVAGVLLYRVFTFFIEIPVGGVGLVAWLWARRRGFAW